MDWIIPLIAVAIIASFFLLKRMSFVTEEKAREHLAAGALVIDVRSPEEFRSGKVPGAINVPLGALRENISTCVKDKNQPLLVHCLSGGRSAIAKQQLKSLGYMNVFNLGSFSKARKILSAGESK